MINTVLGKISGDKLGVTLMHEHITWDWEGAQSKNTHDIEAAVQRMLPFLLDLKVSGCSTLVEATPLGAGKDLDVLVECSAMSGLNIITNTGVWDGGENALKYTPDMLKEKNIDEISNIWCEEYYNGVGDSRIKPGFIKLALGDTGVITPFQEKILRAAARTSKLTKLPVQCHTFSAASAVGAVKIIEDERLQPDKFIWVHADGERNIDVIRQLLNRGIWIELDCLARTEDLNWHAETLKLLLNEGYAGRILISQDAGTFYFGEENEEGSIFPYSRVFKEFIPLCIEKGIPREFFDTLFVNNTLAVLDI